MNAVLNAVGEALTALVAMILTAVVGVINILFFVGIIMVIGRVILWGFTG